MKGTQSVTCHHDALSPIPLTPLAVTLTPRLIIITHTPSSNWHTTTQVDHMQPGPVQAPNHSLHELVTNTSPTAAGNPCAPTGRGST